MVSMCCGSGRYWSRSGSDFSNIRFRILTEVFAKFFSNFFIVIFIKSLFNELKRFKQHGFLHNLCYLLRPKNVGDRIFSWDQDPAPITRARIQIRPYPQHSVRERRRKGGGWKWKLAKFGAVIELGRAERASEKRGENTL
jgi:hypothetical protein